MDAGRVTKLTRPTLIALAGTAVALATGFLMFVGMVVGTVPPASPRAEGIVVLTGGTDRIDTALRLLAEGRASRLLISGVNPSVTPAALAGTLDPQMEEVLLCCVDLGRAAQDTIGNAAEARTWAEGRGFRSLIVVTSDYHMPRSLAELAGTMPTVELIAYPIPSPGLHPADWWRDTNSFALLVREYGKYLIAAARNALQHSPPPAAAGS
jgi:uncharacterized SAM-binding protein YcdF (DUF218 family)